LNELTGDSIIETPNNNNIEPNCSQIREDQCKSTDINKDVDAAKETTQAQKTINLLALKGPDAKVEGL